MQRRSVLALAAVGAAALPGMAAAAAPPKTYFVLAHTPGPAWDRAKPTEQQPLGPHLAYMRGYFDAGQIVMGGPFLDNSGGMMIFNAASLDAAQAIANADPCVKNGLLLVAVHPWLAAFSRLG